MLRVKDIKDAFGIKPKVNVNDESFVTEGDIIAGNIFPSFHEGDKLINIRSGLTVYAYDVYLSYPQISRIEIETNDFFPPCGGSQDLKVYAYYKIYRVDKEGNAFAITEEKKDLVNALIKLTGDNTFSFVKDGEKTLLVNNTRNDVDDIECDITATYYYNGKKYQAFKKVIQNVNSFSPWLIEKDETQYITLTLGTANFPADGGITTAKVERCYSRFYYKMDSCGNKVESKVESELIEDVTKKSILSSSNKVMAKVLGNSIQVFSQPLGASEREGGVTARYLGFEASAALKQAKGREITYQYALTFEDTLSNIKYLDLDTALETSFEIPIISTESAYDEELVNTIAYTGLTITSDANWVKGEVKQHGKDVVLSVEVTERNDDKLNDREATITISNRQTDDISLVILQPTLDIIDNYYTCEIFGNGEYTTEELTNESVYCELHHMLRYEDGSTVECLLQGDLKVQIDFKSENSALLNAYGYTRKGNRFYVAFLNETKNSVNDIEVIGKFGFVAPGIIPFTSDTFKVTVKGNDIVNYNYEFCFAKHDKFNTVSWDDNKDAVVVDVLSVKYKMVNGKTVEKENAPFTALVLNENDEPVFDDTFSIKIMTNNNLLVFPNKVDGNVEKTVLLKQDDTHATIKLKLSYTKKQEFNDVKLKVTLVNTDASKEIWTDENGFVMIDDAEIIKLSPCWLHPTMKDNSEVVYEGNMLLSTGEHQFETYNIYAINFMEKTRLPRNIKQTVNVDASTDIIDLVIKL